MPSKHDTRYLTNHLDIVRLASSRDVCVVMPTFEYAEHYWPQYITAAKHMHGEDCPTTTRTAIVFRCVHTVLRLWIPHWGDPIMPMDYPTERRNFVLVSPYFREKELERWL